MVIDPAMARARLAADKRPSQINPGRGRRISFSRPALKASAD